jgi:hypothetical protein
MVASTYRNVHIGEFEHLLLRSPPFIPTLIGFGNGREGTPSQGNGSKQQIWLNG